MKKEHIFLILLIIFTVLTFIGIGYVLVNHGQVSAGFAVIPMLFALIFGGLYGNCRKSKE